MTTTIAISNQKGGVAKTTTTVNLGAALAKEGHRVLLVDLDPHTGLTNALRLDPDTLPYSTYHAFLEPDSVKPDELAHELPALPGVFIMPASDDLAVVEMKIREDPSQIWQQALANYLARLSHPFDYILLDCPGSLGAITVNAFLAAQHVLVPVQPEKPAIDALVQLEEQVTAIKKQLNPELDFRLLATMKLANRSHHDQGLKLLREDYGEAMFDTVIPHTIRFADSATHGLSLIHYEPTHKGATAYHELATEVLALWLNRSST